MKSNKVRRIIRDLYEFLFGTYVKGTAKVRNAKRNFMIVIYFLTWTLLLYMMHRVVHIVPLLSKNHYHHHAFILINGNPGFHWSNLFLFNDDWPSTIDLWITEVIPTILFCWLIDDYSLLLFYWLWAALLQETLEHNENLNVYALTMGQWHMQHHYNSKCNFGLFIPIWDKLFRTEFAGKPKVGRQPSKLC